MSVRLWQTKYDAKHTEVQELKDQIKNLKQQNESLQIKYDKLSELFQAQQVQGWTNLDLDDHK